LLLTGDITDSGQEWDLAERLLLRPLKSAGIKIVMAPGNHDLHPGYRSNGADNGTPAASPLQLVHDFLASQASFGVNLHSYDKQALSDFMTWKPSPDEVMAKSREGKAECVNAMMSIRMSPTFCDDKGDPKWATETLVAERFAKRCADLFPMVHHDPPQEITILTLCATSATDAGGVGDSAIGSFGDKQLERLKALLADIPLASRFVFVMLHHRPVRPRDQRWAIPSPFWSKAAWGRSPLYHYSFLRSEWQEANALVESLIEAARSYPNKTFLLLYGHGHESYLGRIFGGNGETIWISEAEAAFAQGWIRRGYLTAQPGQLRFDQCAAAPRSAQDDEIVQLRMVTIPPC
jgi:hypothetical protein